MVILEDGRYFYHLHTQLITQLIAQPMYFYFILFKVELIHTKPLIFLVFLLGHVVSISKLYHWLSNDIFQLFKAKFRLCLYTFQACEIFSLL